MFKITTSLSAYEEKQAVNKTTTFKRSNKPVVMFSVCVSNLF